MAGTAAHRGREGRLRGLVGELRGPGDEGQPDDHRQGQERARGETKAFLDRAVTFGPCSTCSGTRLNEVARSCLVDGHDIAELSAMQISDLATIVKAIGAPPVAPLVAGLADTLTSLVEIGLGYLSLDR